MSLKRHIRFEIRLPKIIYIWNNVHPQDTIMSILAQFGKCYPPDEHGDYYALFVKLDLDTDEVLKIIGKKFLLLNEESQSQ